LSDRANVLLIGAMLTLDRLNAATAASRRVVAFDPSRLAAGWRGPHGDHAMPPEPSAIATLGWVVRAKTIAAESFHAEDLGLAGCQATARTTPTAAARACKHERVLEPCGGCVDDVTLRHR
jgi:hypothetical protein